MYTEKIDHLISESMKNGNKVELSVWRALKNEFLTYKTAKAGNVVNDEVEGKIILKLITQHKDSIEQFRQAGRNDLVENEENELKILSEIAPKEPTEEDLLKAVKDAIETVKISQGDGYTPSMRDMKTIQMEVKKTFPVANGGTVAKIFGNLIKK